LKKIEIVEIITDIDIAKEIMERTNEVTPPISTHKMRIYKKVNKKTQDKKDKVKNMEKIRDMMLKKESKSIYKEEIMTALEIKASQVSRFAYSFNKFLMEDKTWALKRAKDTGGLYYYLMKYGD